MDNETAITIDAQPHVIFNIIPYPDFYLGLPKQKRYGKIVDVTTTKKIGRNAPCKCNSGKKNKNCCQKTHE
jgi:uncharacterized protein YecA (UPF0149 family)